MPRSSSQVSTLHPEILSSIGHRFYVRIQHKFRQRIVEWAGAAQITSLGWVLMQPDDSFGASGSFIAMAELFSEDTWAGILLIIGISRFIALIINGSMEAVTPWFRAVGAVFGFSCFAVITYSMLASKFLLGSPYTTGLAMYPVAASCEVAAMYLAFMDARIYRNGRS